MWTDTQASRATWWFLALSGLYFLLQAAQRTWLGGALEVDEAEMLLMAQGFAWGYGPQLPLYNWAQVAAFWMFGPGTAGLAFLKDAVLWLAGAGMWFAMRAAFGSGRNAAAAALSLAFLPNILWEFQRASTHSVALLAALTWTLWAWFSVMQRQSLRNWLILGLILGIGGLSKANYWAVPVGLAVASIGLWPARVQGKGVGLALLVAAAIVAVPYHWAFTHPQDSLASVHKFYQDDPVVWPWLDGLVLLAGNLGAGLILPLVIAAALRLVSGPPGPMPVATKILLRAAALNMGVAALLVVAFGVTKIQSRWLVPILIFVTAGGFGWLVLTPRRFRVVPILAAVCGAVTILGMAQVRSGPTATLNLTPLVQLVAELAPDRIEGNFLIAGNLKLLLPVMDIRASGSTAKTGDWPQRLLILDDLPPGVTELQGGVLKLSSADKSGRSYRIGWHVVSPQK